MTPRTRPRKWREVKRRPVPGNSPNDRILHGPGCNRPKRVCADSFSATPSPQPPRIEVIRGMRFSGMTESIGPMGAGLCDKACRVAAAPCRAPLVRPIRSTFPLHGSSGARFAARSRSSSAMSSGRLVLDRVARQHCPSPLHRHGQNNTHSLPARSKPDISTLRRIGHFYFALTDNGWKLQIVKRRERAFKITGLTWIVERTFAWLGRNRRLSKDYEYAVQTSETMIDIAAIRLMLNRLTAV